jgi:hypothetical protein
MLGNVDATRRTSERLVKAQGNVRFEIVAAPSGGAGAGVPAAAEHGLEEV